MKINKKILIIVAIIIAIALIFLSTDIVRFGNNTPPVVNVEGVDIPFSSMHIRTGLYNDNIVGYLVHVVRTYEELQNYNRAYDHERINEEVGKITKDYFDNNVLVIVIKPESSGSNSISVQRITTVDDTNSMNIYVHREVPEIGTTDMAMWHLLIEISKENFKNTDSVQVID